MDNGSLGSHFMICGDLNCPEPVGSKGLIGKDLGELIDGYNLIQHAKVLTHKTGNILDHIISPNVVSMDQIMVRDVGFSDHHLITSKVVVDIKRQPF